MKRALTLMIAGGALAVMSGAASAHGGNVGFSVSIGAPVYAPPVYYAPPPVYYAPPPVYYPPPRVYYAPPAVYYGPPAYYGGYRHGYGYGDGRGHGHGRHGRR
jgi:hypothetical protein